MLPTLPTIANGGYLWVVTSPVASAHGVIGHFRILPSPQEPDDTVLQVRTEGLGP